MGIDHARLEGVGDMDGDPEDEEDFDIVGLELSDLEGVMEDEGETEIVGLGLSDVVGLDDRLTVKTIRHA